MFCDNLYCVILSVVIIRKADYDEAKNPVVSNRKQGFASHQGILHCANNCFAIICSVQNDTLIRAGVFSNPCQ